MIPGLSAQFIEKGKEKEGQAKIKRYLTIMDSMTEKGELSQNFLFSNQAGHVSWNLFDSCCLLVELDNKNPKLMNESRINRITRGSGRLVKEVVDMLEEHKRIAKMWSKLPLQNIKRPLTNNRDLKPLVNALPPNMLNQLGGLNGLHNMMKQMDSQKRRDNHITSIEECIFLKMITLLRCIFIFFVLYDCTCNRDSRALP